MHDIITLHREQQVDKLARASVSYHAKLSVTVSYLTYSTYCRPHALCHAQHRYRHAFHVFDLTLAYIYLVPYYLRRPHIIKYLYVAWLHPLPKHIIWLLSKIFFQKLLNKKIKLAIQIKLVSLIENMVKYTLRTIALDVLNCL